MSIRQSLTPFVAQAITSNKTRNLKRAWFELTRFLLPSRNTVTFFHKVDDPYSYLLLQALPRLMQDFKIHVSVQLVLDLPPEGTPEPNKLQAYALQDCIRLAEFHDLSFPDHPQQPSAANAFAATALLIKHRDSPKLLHLMLEVTGALWKDSTTTFESCVKRYGTAPENEARTALQNAVDTLQRMGHYNSAMLHYGNEWYWGLDRLGHLAERLNRPSMRRSHEDIADYQRQYRHVLQSYNTLKPRPRQLKPMEFYFSFRSPYSYLAAGRLFKLQELYQFPLSLRPVMPMVTRGIPLPPEKKMYILKDAKREAQRFNIPFGRVNDPLGEGVDRCMALFPWAQAQGKAKEYILSVMTGIWAEGANISDDGTLKKLIERVGLSWDDACKALSADISSGKAASGATGKDASGKDSTGNERWKSLVELNRKDLESLGLWGVPTIRYGDLVVWGQDRLWAIEQEMLLSRNGKS